MNGPFIFGPNNYGAHYSNLTYKIDILGEENLGDSYNTRQYFNIIHNSYLYSRKK